MKLCVLEGLQLICPLASDYEKNLCAKFSKFLFSSNESSLSLLKIYTSEKARVAFNRKKSIFKLVSLAAVIRVVTQRSSPLTAAHDSLRKHPFLLRSSRERHIPFSGEERCVTTLITAARETIFKQTRRRWTNMLYGSRNALCVTGLIIKSVHFSE